MGKLDLNPGGLAQEPAWGDLCGTATALPFDRRKNRCWVEVMPPSRSKQQSPNSNPGLSDPKAHASPVPRAGFEPVSHALVGCPESIS